MPACHSNTYVKPKIDGGNGKTAPALGNMGDIRTFSCSGTGRPGVLRKDHFESGATPAGFPDPEDAAVFYQGSPRQPDPGHYGGQRLGVLRHLTAPRMVRIPIQGLALLGRNAGVFAWGKMLARAVGNGEVVNGLSP